MFYAGMAAPTSTGVMSIGRATATVADPFTWTQYASNPIISGPSGHSIRLDSVQRVAGTWYLYSTDVDANDILLYTSTDGFSFTPQGAVLTAGGQGCSDGSVVSQGAVMYDAGTWRMYYSYRGAQTLPGVRYATSSDGITWTKQGCVDVISKGAAGQPDSQFIEWHQIQKIGSYYVLSYEGYDGTKWTENIAYSSFPHTGWQKSQINPVFAPSGSGWDSHHVATPAYFQIGSTWYLFYQGTTAPQGGFSYSSGNWSLGIATLPGGLDPTSAIP
jgi:hypothetical protein